MSDAITLATADHTRLYFDAKIRTYVAVKGEQLDAFDALCARQALTAILYADEDDLADVLDLMGLCERCKRSRFCCLGPCTPLQLPAEDLLQDGAP